MDKVVLFLRGINVGGRNKLPMADLKSSLCKHGFEDVITYLQSGNVILGKGNKSEPDITNEVADLILNEFSINIELMSRTNTDLATSIRVNPFKDQEADPSRFFVIFLKGTPERGVEERLLRFSSKRDKVKLVGNELYFYASDGFGNSKLASKLNLGVLGTQSTTRNWSTLLKAEESSRE